MKLLFYGGGCEAENAEIDKAVLKQINVRKPSITYIPSSSYEYEADLKNFTRHYKKLKINKIVNLTVDVPVDKVMQKYAFKSDIIHLSGGNTYYFLYYLRKNGYLKKLRHFVEKGGLLTGLSAGAILMSPNINTAGFPKFDRDENCVRIKNFNALRLVNFEFFPHYVNSKRYDKALTNYSLQSENFIYACPDGTGIFIDGKKKTLFGKIYGFYQGHKIIL